MSTHTFNCGDTVMVYQMSAHSGLMIEGQATIVERILDLNEMYVVRFRADVGKHRDLKYCPVYNRLVDPKGQQDPIDYIDAYNLKIGYTHKRKEPAMRDYNV